MIWSRGGVRVRHDSHSLVRHIDCSLSDLDLTSLEIVKGGTWGRSCGSSTCAREPAGRCSAGLMFDERGRCRRGHGEEGEELREGQHREGERDSGLGPRLSLRARLYTRRQDSDAEAQERMSQFVQ